MSQIRVLRLYMEERFVTHTQDLIFTHLVVDVLNCFVFLNYNHAHNGRVKWFLHFRCSVYIFLGVLLKNLLTCSSVDWLVDLLAWFSFWVFLLLLSCIGSSVSWFPSLSFSWYTPSFIGICLLLVSWEEETPEIRFLRPWIS